MFISKQPSNILGVFLLAFTLLAGLNFLTYTGNLQPVISPVRVGYPDCGKYSTDDQTSEKFQKYQECFMSTSCPLCASVTPDLGEYQLNIGWPVGFTSSAPGYESFSLSLQTVKILAIDFIVAPIFVSVIVLALLELSSRRAKTKRVSPARGPQISSPSYLGRVLVTFVNHFRTEPRRFSIMVYILYVALPVYIFYTLVVIQILLGYYNIHSEYGSNWIPDVLAFVGLSVLFASAAVWLGVSKQRGALLKKFSEIFRRYFFIPTVIILFIVVGALLGPKDGAEGFYNSLVTEAYLVVAVIVLVAITIWRLFKEIK